MQSQDKRVIGFELKCVNNLIRRSLDQRFAEHVSEEMSGMQGPVIGYIFTHCETGDVFQKDIEKEFNIRRSTASVMLQNMEQKGLILREPVAGDKRLKRIVLTDKAKKCHMQVKKQIDQFNRVLEDGIAPEEKEQFLAVLDRIKANLGCKL
ncbi:MAG: winged helix-turn-helix transcriptional regulator [Lachnospiraceae bacterium]|nr:winged helix-turn-helix transcriptional regulator [Lachnospiraceae bacterium]MBP5222534.1 winged helix-turn-helix transcriptional regulator [Lachnospiraceae bacterium]